MATASPLWVGASLHLRVPASELAPFGYTVLGKMVRIAFPRAVTTAQEAEQVLGEMIRQEGVRT